MKSKAKLPTLLGIFVLVSGLIAGIFLINSRQVFKLGAQVDSSPKEVRITNITNNSATVTWTTEIEAKGFVKWNKTKTNLNKVALEDGPQQSNIHSVNIIGIEPNSDFYFDINSNGKDYKNGDLSWQSKTLDYKVNSSNLLTASGVILMPDGNTPVDAIVYLTIDGKILSATTSSAGSWIIPISTYLEGVSETSVIEINVNAGPNGVAQAIIYPSAVKETPIILLGKSYDFRTINKTSESSLPKSNLSLPESVQVSSRFETNKIENSGEKSVVTLESINNGEIIMTTDPEFFGKGPTEASIEISVESELQTAVVATSKDGTWKWSPPTDLEPGEHTVTVKWIDVDGIARTITRNFVVSASEGPAFESTQSASLSSPKPSSTPVPTISPNIAATSIPVPETGSLTPTVGLFIMGIVMLLTSVFVWKKEYAQYK